jgi:bifunctional DNA-binding transcriptional regulator/antitoxin component of YhaV-PrlF toxin-antitoxin module
MELARVTSKGEVTIPQMTIPKSVRGALGIDAEM